MKITQIITLTALLLSACSTPPTTRDIARTECEYGNPLSCKQGEYCVNVDHGVATCQAHEVEPKFTLDFPYTKGTDVICDQGTLSPKGESHTWRNTAFAVDLQSDRKVKEVKILAGASGKVIVHDGCTTESDKCGGGFGNAVKILTDDGYLIQYAHLKKVFVKSGDQVRAGDLLGIEGTTGWTGVGNRHLHLSVHYDWRPKSDLWNTPGYLPPSVPFKLSMCEGDVDVRKLVCRRTSRVAPKLCIKD